MQRLTRDFTVQNPWCSDEKALAPLRHALLLAERSGYLKTRNDYEQHLSPEELQEAPSMKLISLQRDVTKIRKELYQTNLEIQRVLQDKETKDITHLEIIEKKIEMIKSLNAYLQRIISRKEELISRLKQPFVGDYVRLDASYHKYAVQVMSQITPLLGELSKELNNISWMKQANFSDGRLDSVQSELAHALAMLQTSFQALNKGRESVSELHQSISHSD